MNVKGREKNQEHRCEALGVIKELRKLHTFNENLNEIINSVDKAEFIFF